MGLLCPVLIWTIKVISENEQEERKTQNDLTGVSIKQARTVAVLRSKSIYFHIYVVTSSFLFFPSQANFSQMLSVFAHTISTPSNSTLQLTPVRLLTPLHP